MWIYRESKKSRVLVFLLVIPFIFLTGCGVRGRPQPPLSSSELGRGEPIYDRSNEGLKLKVPGIKSLPRNWQDDEKLEEEEE